MSTPTYLISLGLFFGTCLLIGLMHYLSTAYAARAKIAGEGDYKRLAEKSAVAQAESQASLAALQAEVARLVASLASVEKILKQVE